MVFFPANRKTPARRPPVAGHYFNFRWDFLESRQRAPSRAYFGTPFDFESFFKDQPLPTVSGNDGGGRLFTAHSCILWRCSSNCFRFTPGSPAKCFIGIPWERFGKIFRQPFRHPLAGAGSLANGRCITVRLAKIRQQAGTYRRDFFARGAERLHRTTQEYGLFPFSFLFVIQSELEITYHRVESCFVSDKKTFRTANRK